jgi:hypothetical protein
VTGASPVRSAWLKLLATKASDLMRLRPEHVDRVLDRVNDNERDQ